MAAGVVDIIDGTHVVNFVEGCYRAWSELFADRYADLGFNGSELGDESLEFLKLEDVSFGSNRQRNFL